MKRQPLHYALLSGVAAAFLFPLAWLLLTSFKVDTEIYHYPITILPQRWTLVNYVYVFTQLAGFGRFLVNSLAVTGTSVVLILVFGALGGYPLARKEFPGKRALLAFLVLVIAVPWVIYLIPTFVMEEAVGLRNSWLGLILPYVALNLPWALLIMQSAFVAIPQEVIDAARVDGAGEFQTWLRILVPLTTPGLATTFLIVFVFVWKEFLYAVTLMTESEWQTLPVGIIQIKAQLQSLAFNILSPTIIVTLLPILVVFLLLRNFLTAGVLGAGGFGKE
ncbi:MAG TPA: carbohydrate ABC transporter permease [bacterium]|nr:carbohydrate ABC transporter permease [bacterium]